MNLGFPRVGDLKYQCDNEYESTDETNKETGLGPDCVDMSLYALREASHLE